MRNFRFFSILSLLLITSSLVLTSAKQKEYTATIPGWHVDLEAAEKESMETGKPIMANFTGSDWCGWCKVLKREVFITKTFKEWAKENVVLLELDFPRGFKVPENIQAQNYSLQKALKVGGYPTVWVFQSRINPDSGKRSISAWAKSGYVRGGAKVWINDLQQKMDFAKEQMSKR